MMRACGVTDRPDHAPAYPARRERSLRAVVGLVILLTAACGEPTGLKTFSVDLQPTADLLVGVGDTATFRATVLDGAGAAVSGITIAWVTGDASVASVDGAGLVTAVGAGETSVTATAGAIAATATVEVWIPAVVAAWEPGKSYFGRRQYIEYVPGELPLILSAPHGGDMTPDEISDRTWGTTDTDRNTIETLWAVRDALVERTGAAPHLIVSHLRRTKLDPNREIVEAAQGNPFAENAWAEFQAYIDVAAGLVTETYGSGLYVDLHGHGHAIARVELGYLLTAADLDRSDAELDAGGYAERSSIRAISAASPLTFSGLLRGPASFGALLAAEGFPSVPSPADPSPGAAPYFSGGYDTDRHGSRGGGTVSGIQIELYFVGVRDSDASRRAFAHALAAAVEAYMTEHWGFFELVPTPASGGTNRLF
jgi:N-formylglutamate amidohydrolase